jgi:MinD superfamily P-loop ATPase
MKRPPGTGGDAVSAAGGRNDRRHRFRQGRHGQDQPGRQSGAHARKNARLPVQLLDCDVEEPNAHLFLAGTPLGEETINIAVPDFDPDKCDACDKCVEFCQFNALASVGKTPLLFPELCHGCGGCTLVCPQDAIREKDYRIGVIKTARAGSITLKSGCLDVGVSLASTLVHALKERLEDGITTLLDAPPGTACQAVATLRGSDFVVLVTEPTPFGLHDLTLAVDTVRALDLRFGVVINRVGVGDDRVQRYCAARTSRSCSKFPTTAASPKPTRAAN